MKVKPSQPRMYGDLAHLWPLVSPPEDYREEGRFWRKILREKLGPGRHEILELGVGGGHNLHHLVSEFKATAVDSSTRMLENSIRLNPDVEHHVGDMRTVRLERKFQAVLIHDAIGYLLSEDDIRDTFATALAHLEMEGVLVIAPDWFRENFPGSRASHSTHREGSLEVTLFEYVHDPDPGDTTIESLFIFVINDGGKVRIEHDLHVMGLFPMETWVRLMGEFGFRVEKRPYPVHDDERQAYLIVGVLDAEVG